MKNKISLLFIILNNILFAQVILNYTDYNPIGNANVYTSNINGFSIGTSGSNQTWDYSSLTLNLIGSSNNTVVSTGPFINNFPNTNYITKSASNGIEYFTYKKITASKLENLGVSTNSVIIVDFNPNPQTQFEFPYTYNYNITDSYSIATDPTTNNSFTILYDAYGTLITPLRTYSNVFRTKKLDGIFPEYTWYSKNPTVILLSVKTGSTGINSIVFYDYNNLNIENYNINNRLNISPNPTNDKFTISNNLNDFTSDIDIEMIDNYGRIVSKIKTKFYEEINVDYLLSGIYLIKITNESGSNIYKKLIKN